MAENVVRVQDHFWCIEEDGVRAFLFEGTERAMLVDTCFGAIPLREIVEGLTDRPVFVVHTHADVDHIGCNRDFEPVYMHPSEMDYYKARLPKGCSARAVRPLWEGELIDLGCWKFEVILTPGHTPGSIMLLEREKRMLISGDSIQNGDIYMFNPGRNIPALIASLEKMQAMSGLYDTIWPSHGDYPIKPEIIPGILQGVKDLVAGKLEGREPEAMPWMKGCRRYRCDVAGFMYNPGEWDETR